MPDRYTEVTKTGLGTRLGRSIKGIFFGIILFLASFVVLYWNEGRVDVSRIAEDATEISATEQTEDAQGELVYVRGMVKSDEKVGDGLFLEPGDYLAANRDVEVYAWVEKSSSKSETEWGGSETTETTYEYVKEWTGNPSSSSGFKYPEGHENPTKGIEDADFTVESAKVGIYDLDMNKISLLSLSELTLNDEVIDLSVEGGNEQSSPEEENEDEETVSSGFVISSDDEEETVDQNQQKENQAGVISGNYIFIGEGSMGEPQIGDMRISYKVLKNDIEAAVIGKLDGQKISPYVDKDTDEKIYRMFDGTKDEAVSQMHSEYKMMLWIFRIIGFLMMWIGLSSLFAPISVLLDIAPFLGSLSRSVVGFITFIVAFVLSLAVIIVSMILHSLLAVIVVSVVVLVVVVLVLRAKGKKKMKMQKPPTV